MHHSQTMNFGNEKSDVNLIGPVSRSRFWGVLYD